MSIDQMNRSELLEALNMAGRRLSTSTVLFHSAVADQFGLNATDWKCAELLTQSGPITAGELAELSGLTTGAITGVVDRLEEAGMVQRQRDVHDRRRVIIQYNMDQALESRVGQVLEGLTQGVAKVAAKYSDGELALILEYLSDSTEMLQEEAVRLRQKTAETVS